MKKITIPNGVTKIEAYTFSLCENLTLVSIPGSVKVIGCRAFDQCKKLKHITLQDGVEKINEFAFQGCENLNMISIPNTVNTIGTGAFNYCLKLRRINIPNNIEVIYPYTFANCQNLASITIPNGVNEIGEAAFHSCVSLRQVRIPKSVTYLGKEAFRTGFLDRFIVEPGSQLCVVDVITACGSDTNRVEVVGIKISHPSLIRVDDPKELSLKNEEGICPVCLGSLYSSCEMPEDASYDTSDSTSKKTTDTNSTENKNLPLEIIDLDCSKEVHHYFHKSCLEKYVGSLFVCPVCQKGYKM